MNKIGYSLTCFYSFSFISLPVLRHIVGKRVIRVWSTKQCLDAEDQKHQVQKKCAGQLRLSYPSPVNCSLWSCFSKKFKLNINTSSSEGEGCEAGICALCIPTCVMVLRYHMRTDCDWTQGSSRSVNIGSSESSEADTSAVWIPTHGQRLIC